MPTLEFCCSAGCGINAIGALGGVRHWGGIIGAAPSVEAVSHVSGGYSYRWNTVGAAAARRLDGPALLIAPAGREACARIAFKFDTLPDANVTIIGWGIGSGTAPLVRYRSATQDVVGSLAANVTATSAPITAGVWYYCDVYMNTGDTRTIKVQITTMAGVITDLGTLTSGSAAADTTGFRLGMGCAAETVQGDLYITSIAVSHVGADYPIGPGAGRALRPRADETHNFDAVADFKYDNTTNMPSTAPTDTYTYVDDMLDNISDFIAASGVSAGEYLEWLMDAAPDLSAINGIQVVSAHHASGTAANIQTMRLIDGGSTNDVFTDADFSQTTIVYNSKQYTTAPSGGAWTKAKLDAIKFRWGSSWTTVGISPVPFIDGLVVEVDYVPALLATLTGTALASITEADIVAGGKTLIITLSGGAKWIDA